MAEFCYQCTEDVLGIPGKYNDFSGMGEVAKHEQGLHCNVLCEGCGHIQVDFQGKRVGPNPIKLQKELNRIWRESPHFGTGELTNRDRTFLIGAVCQALQESGHNPAEFDIEISIDEDNKSSIEWSYSKKK